AGAGVGGTVGGITGALVGVGIPEYEAKRFEGRIKKGDILLSVHCDSSDWTKKAKRLLERTGADDVSSSGEASADFAKSDKPQPRSAGVGRFNHELVEERTYIGVERRVLDPEESEYAGVERRRAHTR